MQERHNSIAWRLSCTNPSTYATHKGLSPKFMNTDQRVVYTVKMSILQAVVTLETTANLCLVWYITSLNTVRLAENGWHLADGIFKCVFFNENDCIVSQIWSLFLKVQLTSTQVIISSLRYKPTFVANWKNTSKFCLQNVHQFVQSSMCYKVNIIWVAAVSSCEMNHVTYL